MKMLIKPLLLTLSLGLPTLTASFATTAPVGIIHPKTAVAFKTGVYVNAGGKLNIALDKDTGGTVSVMLKNAKGDILFSQSVPKKDQQFRVSLDLTQLPDGSYTVACSNGLETTQQTVTLQTKEPTTPRRVIMTDGLAQIN